VSIGRHRERRPRQGRRGTRSSVARAHPLAASCATLGALTALLLLSGCESSQEKSAKLERAAKLAVRSAPKGLSIARPSKRVRATATSVVTSSEGTAALVTLHNSSAVAERDVPVAITVHNAAGATVYTNTLPGISHQLTSAPLVPAHGSLLWIDDQVPATGGQARSVTALVGEGTPAGGAAPSITVTGAHIVDDPSNGIGGEATVSNHSSTEQRELVVFATALRGGRVVAAGRAVVPQLAAGGSASVQVFFVGNPAGAQLRLSAPATTLP
jgi:hypothetical protein